MGVLMQSRESLDELTMTEVESRLRERLGLFKEVSKLSNPRFGVDPMLNSIMRLLKAYYRADECLFVTEDVGSGQFLLRRSNAQNPGGGSREEAIPEALGRRLTALPAGNAAVYQARAGGRRRRCSVYGVESWEASPASAETAKGMGQLAALLGADSFITVPFTYSKSGGRLYLFARAGELHDADPEFLRQLLEHVLPYLENVRLIDRLATAAAENERQRIARDIHDSVIQPYIGLQIGLEAVRQKLRAGEARVEEDIDRLIEMSESEVTDLRAYMRDLKSGARLTSHEGNFIPAVRRFAAKFAETTHIDVDVRVRDVPLISDRLAAEAFQIVAEGLSNIRRHTVAESVVVDIGCDDEHFLMRIENCGGPQSKGFLPKSITERATSLGGTAVVEERAGGGAAVCVRIPL